MTHRNRLFIFLALMLLSIGCAKKLFHFVVPLVRDERYTVDQNGAFGSIDKITSAEIRDALNVPEDGEVTRVDIESMSLKVNVLDGNQAKWIKASGYIEDDGKPLYFFQDQLVTLVGVDVKYVGLNALIEAGVKKLAKRINDHVKRINDADIEVGIAGDSDPPGQRIKVLITLTVKATVLYDQCVEVPDFIGGEKSCED